MSRLRRSNRARVDTKRLVLFFLAGVAAGCALSFIFYRFNQAGKYRPAPIASYGIKRQSPALSIPERQKPIPPIALARFKIAIVLDDFGYNEKNIETVFDIRRPVTFSILPHRPYSKEIAAKARGKGYEVILHLPLQARENDKQEPTTITTAMKKKEVLDKLAGAIEGVPYCGGISNHQGSKATEDAELMRIIFEELKKRNLFFLDSLVTERSVCKKMAKDIRVRFARRDVFLDNNEDFEYIKSQMKLLIRKAKKGGSAIGIGHDRTKTIKALSELIPEAEGQGAEFVYVSELIR